MKVAYGSDNPEMGGAALRGPPALVGRQDGSGSRRKKKGLAAAAASSLLLGGALMMYHASQTSSAPVATATSASTASGLATMDLSSDQQSVYDAVLAGAKFILRVPGKNNLCVDDGNGWTASSSQFSLWDCDTNNKNQVFVYDAAGHRLRNPYKNLCVDDAGGWAGVSRFLLWYCEPGNRNQDFVYDQATKMFRNPSQPNMCMDDGGGWSRGERKLTPWYCDVNNMNQRFEFVLVPDPVYDVPATLQAGQEILLRARGKSNLCVDDGGGTKFGETKLGLQPCNPSNPNQMFLYDSKTYQLRSARKNNLCVDDGDARSDGAAKFQLWDCDKNNWNQRFIFDGNTLMFRDPTKNNLCMDDGGVTIPTAASMWLWTCDNNNPNQHFEVVSRADLAAQQQKTLDAVYSGSKFIIRVAGKNNLCLDDGNGQTAASSQYLDWDCDVNNPNQVFVYDTATNRFSSKRKNLCLDDGGGWSAAQTRFVLWYCDVNNKNQDFVYDPVTMMFKNPNKPGQCMDDGGCYERGSKRVLMWYCDLYNPNQHFEFILLPPPTIYATPPMLLADQEILLRLRGKNNLCVDDGGATKNGEAQLGLQPCNPSNPNQMFIYDSKTNLLRSARKNNLCVDDGGATRDGAAKFTLWECDMDNNNQRFVFDDGTLMFKNPAKNNLCMDDGGVTKPTASSFWLWTCDNNNPNQHFEVVNRADLAAEQKKTLDAVYGGAKFIMRIAGKDNLCMDDGNGQTAAASKFTPWTCDFNNPNQVFVYDVTTKRFRSRRKNLCIDDGGTGERGSARMHLWDCHQYNPNQHFDFILAPPIVPVKYNVPPMLQAGQEIMLEARGKNNLCVDDGGATKNGESQLGLQWCNPSSTNQMFIYDNETYQLRSARKNNLCVDDGGATRDGGAKFTLWECDKNNWNQRFVFDDSTLMFRNPTKNNLCMDDGGVTTPTASSFWLWTCDNSNPNQHFKVLLVPTKPLTPDVPAVNPSVIPGVPAVNPPMLPGTGDSYMPTDPTPVPVGFPPVETKPELPDETDQELPPQVIAANPDAYAPSNPTDVPADKVSDVVDIITPQEVPAQPVDPDVKDATFDVTLFDASSPIGADLNVTSDWNLLAPSHATVGFVDADQSDDITSEEIFQFLAGVKARAEQQYEVMMYKYDRTFKCVSAGLKELAKEPVTSAEYHVLVRWMYEHCAPGNAAVDPNANPASPPLTNDDAAKLPGVAPLVADSSADIDRLYMTKLEFYYEIKSYFADDREQLFGQAASTHLRAEEMALADKQLEECVQAAAERFGYTAGVNATDDFAAATKWVSDECMVTGVST